jgi:hypothetical protein
MKLVTSLEQLVENIQRYAASGDEMQELMAYSRAWYGLRTENGWLLGPSKFVGYEKMDADSYRTHRDELDGRATEKTLAKWADLIEEGHPDYEKLHGALAELFARYGKVPNPLARISIIRSEGVPAEAGPTDELVNLLVAVYRRLPAAQQSAFRRIAMNG